MTNKKPVIGIALGSGGARGISHIGIIEGLKEIGVEPDIVCGTSIGALVGAAYVNNNLGKLSSEFSQLTQYELLKFFKPKITKNSYVDIKKFEDFFIKNICDKNKNIEDISKKFGCVATDYNTGEEVKFVKGNIMNSVFSSIALPGLFDPFYNNKKLLIDGGIVNPIPISLCKELGADIVIAVDLNSSLLDENYKKSEKSDLHNGSFFKKIRDIFPMIFSKKKKIVYPSIIQSSSKAIDIMQCRITKYNISQDKPDILIQPKIGSIGVIDFYKYDKAIKEGKKYIKKNKKNILEKINNLQIEGK